jgi:16S rRNA (uracil1498-N3)-methyltransferase
MTPALFLVPDLGCGDRLTLAGPEAHHAATVKRLAVGELVLLSDGRGGLAEARAVQVGRAEVLFEVLGRRLLPAPDPRFVVVQALPKGERADLAVEVLTELGVDEIVPWSASRSIAQWKADRAAKGLARWTRTALEASKQARRPWIPVVADLAGTAEVCARAAAADLALVLHEDGDGPLAGRPLPASGEVLVIVGPEGGVSGDELAAFAAAGARPVRLGPEVLRTSTAGAAALAVLSAQAGRWAATVG